MLETKEELLKQLTASWEIIQRADEALDKSKRALSDAHEDLRRFSKAQHASASIHRRHEVSPIIKA